MSTSAVPALAHDVLDQLPRPVPLMIVYRPYDRMRLAGLKDWPLSVSIDIPRLDETLHTKGALFTVAIRMAGRRRKIERGGDSTLAVALIC